MTWLYHLAGFADVGEFGFGRLGESDAFTEASDLVACRDRVGSRAARRGGGVGRWHFW